jgi:hypothetical protein
MSPVIKPLGEEALEIGSAAGGQRALFEKPEEFIRNDPADAKRCIRKAAILAVEEPLVDEIRCDGPSRTASFDFVKCYAVFSIFCPPGR